jgi:hypothetical protein
LLGYRYGLRNVSATIVMTIVWAKG